MTLSNASKRCVLLVTLLVYLGRRSNQALPWMTHETITYPGVIKASPGSFNRHDFSAERSIRSWKSRTRSDDLLAHQNIMYVPVRHRSPSAVGFARLHS